MAALSALLSTIATAIANNSALDTYCKAQFGGKSISVYVHIDPKNPPSISKAPWVGLTVQSYSRPGEHNGDVTTFDLESAVYCEKSSETTSEKVTSLDGFAIIETLSNMVFAIIETAVTQSDIQTTMDYLNEQSTSIGIAEYPGWLAARNWQVVKL